MIQNVAIVWGYTKTAAQWVSVWAVVTLLLVGGITSFTWAKTTFAGYDWSISLLKSES